MTSQTMTKQPARNYLIQLMVIILLMLIFQFIGVANPVVIAAVVYLLLAFILRLLVLASFRKGMGYYRRSAYDKAIEEFEKCYDFLIRNRWLDDYRYITMISSQISYIEMTLLNMAFCYSQLGNKTMAKELYLKTLTLFPSCEMAKEALKTLEVLSKKNESFD